MFPSDALPTLNSAAEITGGGSFISSYAFQNNPARLSYDFRDKYLVTLTGSYNGSSRFPEDEQYGFFPAAAVGWVISDEDFADFETLSFLKLRSSYGITGNAGIGNFDYLGLLSSGANYVPILRMSEMMLTRAEALAELNGVNEESLNLLNEIRPRAITVTDDNGAPGDQSLIEYGEGDFANAEELIDAILLERRVELSYEGHRMTDLQRRQMDVAGTAWEAPELVFPIPQSQMDANDDLTQNPGY